MAEGLFDDAITEGVHLRIREVDQLVPKSLYPSTSAITYWQIEAEASILKGNTSVSSNTSNTKATFIKAQGCKYF